MRYKLFFFSATCKHLKRRQQYYANKSFGNRSKSILSSLNSLPSFVYVNLSLRRTVAYNVSFANWGVGTLGMVVVILKFCEDSSPTGIFVEEMGSRRSL